MQPENDGKDGKRIPGKGDSKKKSSKQKPSKKSQPSTASAGNEWSVKQIIGGLLGVFSLIIMCAAVVQRRSSTTSHTGVNGHINFICCFFDSELNLMPWIKLDFSLLIVQTMILVPLEHKEKLVHTRDTKLI